MHSDLKELLSTLRKRRKFDPNLYIQAKTRLINDYFRQSGLQACVLGVSGGIDSAVTLALLSKASQIQDSPIQKIICALMPMYLKEGTTGQSEATSRGRETVEAIGSGECVVIDLSQSHQEVKRTVDQALTIQGDAWAAGQLVSNLRTPALYYASSLLTQSGTPAIVVGTTNRDEGAYIGYFGKAADGLVDLQAISDLHKSEVYSIARILNVPQSVLDAIPTGDIYDGRNDEQLIGASYDAIELYSLFRCLDEEEALKLKAKLSLEANADFAEIAKRLDTLNRQCAHKYIGGTPSAHLDIYERAVPGGWRTEFNLNDMESYLSRAGGFVGEFSLKEEITQKMESALCATEKSPPLQDFQNSVGHISNLLSASECSELIANLKDQKWQAVGYNGMLKDYREEEKKIGSYRATAFNKKFAQILWNRISCHLPSLRILSDEGCADWDGDPIWKPVGISPALRFIRYKEQGVLVPHYDAPFEYWEGRRTLMSLIVYLTDSSAEDGGKTRFILDSQRHLPIDKRDFSDWSRFAKSHEVLASVQPKQGSALFFDHRVLHDSEPLLSKNEKIILRTDIVFERCGPRRKKTVQKSKALGFPDSATKTLSMVQEEIDARTLSKVLEDPYYKQIWERFGSRQKLLEAGFFDDELPVGQSYYGVSDTQWLATPIDKITQNLAQAQTTNSLDSKWPAVLITTGGFCPVHKCHVEMLEKAKAELESQGAVVLGGYLSPSHDNYIKFKCADEMLDAHHRLHLCEQAVENSNWLMVDGWESLYCKTSVNYTVVVNRLEKYLSSHIQTHQPIRVFYVFGSDNAGFSYSFLEQGNSVCVLRLGYEEKFNAVSKDPLTQQCKRTYFVDKPTANREVSSKLVRSGEESFLEEKVRRLFRDWKANQNKKNSTQACYFIRNEQNQSVLGWVNSEKNNKISEGFSFSELEKFRNSLMDIFKESFQNAKSPGTASDIDFKILNLSDQKELAKELTRGHKVISMDPFISGDYNLAVSRCFPISSGKGKSTVVARPGYPSIFSQVQAIPGGNYILLDDDITTGSTMKQVSSYLAKEIQIKQCLGLVKLSDQKTDHQLPLDILDFRDFLCGTYEGGLVVKLPNGENVRAPYVLPYVSPADRASVPLCQNTNISRQIWQLNLNFFNSFQPRIKLKDVDPNFQKLMLYVGFDLEDTLTEICSWHIERLI